MISTEVIRQQLQNVLESTHIEGLGERQQGKVRDSYRIGDRRVLIVTDRISAFDCVLGTIPFKGQVLNQLAAFWFEQTKDIAPNHVISVPDPNVMVVRECAQLPLEFVVRGYITGVTKTSAWYNYERGVRNLCGNVLPDGLRKDQKLERPIITPTTKHEKHDRNISREEAIAEGLIDGATFDKAAAICLKLYNRAVEHAASRGLIFVDTKYELGLIDGEIVVSDEINTPDSSRYWFADTYAERFAAGEEQRKLDKEYVRQWLADQGFRGDGPPPVLTDEVRVEAARRYIQAYEVVTGRAFEADTRPVHARMTNALRLDLAGVRQPK
ncbi:MAG: phosphoribosylaminoimidazolesuccinocarboxamide synthase [Lentisphaerae bacterium]|nr:phosphoribosylaminoimidazolesuccinocarboxamide synthase [Lentisphaerota bacterium]